MYVDGALSSLQYISDDGTKLFHKGARTKDGYFKIDGDLEKGEFVFQHCISCHGEFAEGDGISEHIQGGISLVVTVTPVGNGKSLVSPEILKNADMESTE